MKKTLRNTIIFLMLIVSVFTLTACPKAPPHDGDWDNYDKSGPDKPLTTITENGTKYWASFWAFGVEVISCIYGKQGQIDIGAGEAFFEEFEAEVTKYDNEVSTTKAGSDVYKFNRAAKGVEVPIGDYTKKMYDMSLALYDDSEGLFDPCSFNLVDFWGFSPYSAAIINEPFYGDGMGDLARHPYQTSTYVYSFFGIEFAQEVESAGLSPDLWDELKKISNLRDESNKINGKGKLNVECYKATSGPNAGKWVLKKTCDDITVDGKTYTLRIDFGAIGKGYAADIGRDLAEKYSLTKGYIDVNSSKYLLTVPKTSDSDPDKGYEPTITDPRSKDYSMGQISGIYMGYGLSTSGDYEKTYFSPYTLDARYCHILNPVSGYPLNVDPVTKKNYAETAISCTVLHKSAALTDAYATIGLLMSENGNWQKAINWLEERDAHAVLILQTFSNNKATFKVKLANIDPANFKIDERVIDKYIF